MIDTFHRARAAIAMLLAWPIGSAIAQAPEFRWRDINGGPQVELRGMAAGDFDDDGRLEAAIALTGPALVVRIEGFSDTAWRTEQVLIAPSNASSREIPVGWSKPGADGLIVLMSSGEAIVYGGIPLAESARFSTVVGAFAGQIDDVDADGLDELVVAASNGVGVYDLASGQLEWSRGDGASDVQIAQLDADAALEIVLGGPIGRVLDGATQALEWEYPDGFGEYLATGRILSDGGLGVVGAQDWSFATVFQSAPWSPLWNYKRSDIDAVDTCDVDNDGRDEIVLAAGQWGDIHVIDPTTQVDQITIEQPGHGSSDVVARDFNGSGGCQFYFASRGTNAGNRFLVYNAVDGAQLHASRYAYHSFSAADVGDLDGDGQLELIIASQGPKPAIVRVLNADSGDLLWELAPTSINSSHPLYLDVARVLLTQADSDPALEIVLVGTSTTAGRVTVIDSATREVQLQIGSSTSQPMASREAVDATVLDYDDDGSPDILVGTHPLSTGASGARLHVFGLDDGSTHFQSVAIGNGFATIVGVMALDTDADPALELVAVLSNGLRAFDAQSGLLDWTMTLPEGITAAAHHEFAGQFAIARDGSVTTYDASTLAVAGTMIAEGDVDAIAPVDNSHRWVILDAGRLAVYDAFDGDRIGESDWLGPSMPGSQMVARYHADAWRISNSTPLGQFLHDLGAPVRLFADGFEP
jgi:hypothetical protein